MPNSRAVGLAILSGVEWAPKPKRSIIRGSVESGTPPEGPEEASIPEIALVRVTRKGQITVPKALRDKLGIEPGDYLTARPFAGGILISRATVTPQAQAEDILRSLASDLGWAAEQQGIREEEDLKPITEEAQRRAYQERYGR